MKTLFVKSADKRTNTVYDSQSEQYTGLLTFITSNKNFPTWV